MNSIIMKFILSILFFLIQCISFTNCLFASEGFIRDKFNRVQIFRGLNQRKELIVITSNLKTQKWTAWQSVNGKSMCVVAFGSHFKLLEKAGNDV